MTVRKGPSAELGPPLFTAALAALALAGCGAMPAKPHHAAKPACPPIAGSGRVVSSDLDLLTCAYAGAGERLRITFDDGPQAWFRYDRAQVERTQTTIEWANTPAQQPKAVDHVGAGAFWVPATRELVASDGRRLLTVRVLEPTRRNAARAVAVRVAPRGLGPPHVPAKTGP